MLRLPIENPPSLWRVGVALLLAGLWGGGGTACENQVEWVDGQDEPTEQPDEEVFPLGMGGVVLKDGTGAGGQGDEPKPDATGGGSSAPPRPPPDLVVPQGIIWPDSCDARWQYRCEGYDPLVGCSCNNELPSDIEVCGGHGALFCRHFLQAGFDVWVDCECRPGAPNAPEDCLDPATFGCAHTSETGALEQCTCGR